MSPAEPAGPPRSRCLRVRVREGEETRVDLTLGASLAAHLPELIPPGLAGPLQACGVDVGRIAAEVVARGFPVGELFALTEGSKQVRVWLE